MKRFLLLLAVTTAAFFISANSSTLNAQISGFVWDDDDGNGTTNEIGACALVGITVDLRDNTSGLIVDTQLSGAGGAYTVTPLVSGPHTLEFSGFLANAPGTVVYATKYVVSGGIDDSHLTFAQNTAPYLSEVVNFTLGTPITDFNAGVLTCGTVDGVIFEDLEADGANDATDPALADPVTVCLLVDNGLGAFVPAVDAMGVLIPQQAGVIGSYGFTMVPPGTYKIEVKNIPNSCSGMPWQVTSFNVFGAVDATNFTNDSDIDPMSTPTINLSLPFDMTSKQNEINGVDAGFYGLGTVTGSTWEDFNGNGIFDGTDAGWGGAMVCLFVNDGTGAFIPAVMVDGVTPIPCTTGPMYTFNDVPPGDYAVSFELTTGPYFLGTPCDAGAGGTIPDPTLAPDMINDVCYPCMPATLNGFTAQFTVTSCTGLQNLADNIDAMYYQEVDLGDAIFHDGDNDCMNGGAVDQPYTAGDIQLTIERECLPGSGTWTNSFWDNSVPPVQYTSTINSAADGSYCFEDLPPGNYRLEITLPQFWNLSDGELIGGCTPPTDNGTANGAQDSDIDPTGTTSNWIELMSGDPKETDLDFGVWKCMALGGTVWSDGNENGLLDNMEAGMNMIQLEITAGQSTYNVTTNFQPGSTFGGYWELSSYPTASVTACLSPGEYQVEVTAPNFDPAQAGQLINWVSTVDGLVDNDVDGDDSGIGSMVTGVVSSGPFFLECGFEPLAEPDDPFPACDASNNMTVDFGFYFDCTIAQGGQNPFTIYFNCDDSYDDPLCDVGLLDNYCGEMPQSNNGTGPTPLCPGGCAAVGGITGVPHNTSWVSFIAANTCISFDILPSNCQNGTGLQWGVYEAIESPCNGGPCVTCDGNCNGGGVLAVSSCNFVPGNQYFLWLDGCNGTWCDYQIDNVVGAGTFTIPSVDNDECIGCLAPNPPAPGDPYILCTGANSATFCVDTDSNINPNFYDTYVSVYTWEVNGVELPNTTMTNCVTLDFSAYVDGDIITVQMTDVGNQCSNQASPIWTVEIQDPAPEDFGFFDVCEEDFPFTPPGDPNMDGFGWQGTPPIPYDGNNMTETYTAMAMNVPLPGCEIMQTVDILDWPTAQGPAIFAGLCDPGDLYTVGTEIGQPTSYPAPLINFQHTFPDGSLAGGGCDSVINLTLELIQVLGDVILSPCVFQPPPNLPLFNYSFNVLNPLQVSGYDMTYEWVDDMNNVVATGLTFSTSVAGCYSMVASATLPSPAITNNGMGACEFVFGPECFDNADLMPPVPTEDPAWDLAPCVAGGPVTYCIDADIFNNGATDLIWLPTNGTIVSGGGGMDNCIEIEWGASGLAQLEITVIGPCSTTPYLQSINPIPSPEAFIQPIMDACIGECTEISFDDMGTPNPNLTYNWDFGTGVEQNGTGSTGPGPHCVSWATGGMQTVSLTVTEGSCESAPFTADVMIMDPLTPPMITCAGGTATSLEFCWNDVGADDYIPTIVTQTGSGTIQYTPGDLCLMVTGLNILEEVTIQIEAVDNGVCANVFSLEQPCQVQDCQVPVLTVDCTLADVCLTANVATVDLSTCVSADLPGTGVYSGNGVTGTTFDPTDPAVVEGANVITYNYTTDLSCTNSVNIPINVYALPSAAFTATPDICETGMAVIEYDGGMPLPTGFMWNTGGANETGLAGPGPHNLTFNAPGSYTIELITEINGCMSDPISMPIEVHEQVAMPMITCVSTINSVCFTWVEETGVTYNVTHISGAMGTTSPGKYLVTGLNQNDQVEISVTAVSTNAFCIDQTDTSLCTAQPCPPSTVTLDGPATICASDNPVDITAMFSDPSVLDGSETVTWSSMPAGSMNAAGSFDPSVNSGFVQINYLANINGCDYPGTMVIEVIPQVEDPVVVCSDNGVDFVQASWAAVNGAAEYLVTVDAGTAMTVTDLFIDVNGLSINQMVDICVTAVSPDPACPNAGPICVTCTANACDAGIVDITGEPMVNICETDPIVQLNGIVIMNATGLALVLDGDETFTWSSSPNAGAIDANTGAFDPGQAAIGTNTITYEVVDLAGQCPYTGTVTIEVEEELTPPTITCTETIDAITWTWDADPCASEYIVSIDNVVIGPQAGTTYTASGLMEGQMVTINVEVVSMCACGNVMNSLECTASPCPPINVTFTSDNPTFCEGTVTNFPINPTVTGSDGSGTGVWSSTGNVVDANGDFDASVAPGVYDITYTWTEMNCVTTWDYAVEIFENPIVSTELIDPECFLENSGTVTVDVQNGTGPYDIMVNGNPVAPNDAVLVPVGPVNISVLDDNLCEDTFTGVIDAAPEQMIDITGAINGVFPDTLTFNYDTGVAGVDIDSIVWTLSDSTICANCPEGVTITDSLLNAEPLCATLWYNDGCFIEDCTPITIRQITQIYYPTVFNPGGDNNPNWIIGSNAIGIINDIAIFDRWGERVYFNENLLLGQANPLLGGAADKRNEVSIWDGQFKGKYVVPGVYVFVVNYTTNSGLEERHAADITVLR